MIKSIIKFCCIGSKQSKSNVYCEPCMDKQARADAEREVSKKDKMIVIVISKMAKKGVYMSAVRMDPVSANVNQPESPLGSYQSEISMKERDSKIASVGIAETQTRHHAFHKDAQTGDSIAKHFHLFEEWLKEKEHHSNEIPQTHRNKRNKEKGKKGKKVKLNNLR